MCARVRVRLNAFIWNVRKNDGFAEDFGGRDYETGVQTLVWGLNISPTPPAKTYSIYWIRYNCQRARILYGWQNISQIGDYLITNIGFVIVIFSSYDKLS